jgi:hypothetical protein
VCLDVATPGRKVRPWNEESHRNDKQVIEAEMPEDPCPATRRHEERNEGRAEH